MKMEPAGPKVKKMKISRAALTIYEVLEISPAPAAMEANDPKPPTTTEGSRKPPPGAEEVGGEEMPDRISSLPDAILGEIISLLPIREGARTQTLASRWRHLWRAAPLNLDYSRLPGHRDRQDILLGGILSTHQGPGRRLCLPASRLQYRADAVDAWLRSPALDNLHELDLYLPSSTFSRLFSRLLRVITLSQCHLPDDIVDTLSFPQLRKLALVEVRISECSLHSIITTGCPVLESLLLDTRFGVRRLRINSPTLISIGIHSSSDQLIIDDAPSLRRLVHFGMHLQMQVTVVSAPKLETLGYISEYFGQSRIVFGSTLMQVMFLVLLAFSTRLLVSCIFMSREVISYNDFCVFSVCIVYILMFCSMFHEGITH
jgi:hypothetical protein